MDRIPLLAQLSLVLAAIAYLFEHYQKDESRVVRRALTRAWAWAGLKKAEGLPFLLARAVTHWISGFSGSALLTVAAGTQLPMARSPLAGPAPLAAITAQDDPQSTLRRGGWLGFGLVVASLAIAWIVFLLCIFEISPRIGALRFPAPSRGVAVGLFSLVVLHWVSDILEDRRVGSGKTWLLLRVLELPGVRDYVRDTPRMLFYVLTWSWCFAALTGAVGQFARESPGGSISPVSALLWFSLVCLLAAASLRPLMFVLNHVVAVPTQATLDVGARVFLTVLVGVPYTSALLAWGFANCIHSPIPIGTAHVVASSLFDFVSVSATLALIARAARSRSLLFLGAAVFLDLVVAALCAAGTVALGSALAGHSLAAPEIIGLFSSIHPRDGVACLRSPYFLVLNSSFVPTALFLGTLALLGVARVTLVASRWLLVPDSGQRRPYGLTRAFFLLLAGVASLVKLLLG